MKNIFVFFVLFFALKVHAQPTVVFMSSIDLWNKGPFYNRAMFNNAEYELANSFRRFFENSFKVVVKHKADQADVWNTLHDPSVVAFFWFSHANASSVFDHYGFDLLPAFQETHPNLKFLSLIGCDTQDGVKLLKSRGYLSSANLQIAAESGPVEHWQETLNKHLKNSANALAQVDKPALEMPPKKNVVRIQRQLRSEFGLFPAIRVELSNGKVVGTFPRSQNDETQEIEVSLEDGYVGDFVMNAGENLSVTTGSIGKGNIDLGEFKIFGISNGNWVVFNDGRTRIFGETSRVMRFTQTDQLALANESLKTVKENTLPKRTSYYYHHQPKVSLKSGKYSYLFTVTYNLYALTYFDSMSNRPPSIGREINLDIDSLHCENSKKICHEFPKGHRYENLYYFKSIDEDFIVYYNLSDISVYKRM